MTSAPLVKLQARPVRLYHHEANREEEEEMGWTVIMKDSKGWDSWHIDSGEWLQSRAYVVAVRLDLDMLA